MQWVAGVRPSFQADGVSPLRGSGSQEYAVAWGAPTLGYFAGGSDPGLIDWSRPPGDLVPFGLQRRRRRRDIDRPGNYGARTCLPLGTLLCGTDTAPRWFHAAPPERRLDRLDVALDADGGAAVIRPFRVGDRSIAGSMTQSDAAHAIWCLWYSHLRFIQTEGTPAPTNTCPV